MARFTTSRGAQWLHSPSGVAKDLGRVQRGPLYIDGGYEVTASGRFRMTDPSWVDSVRTTTPLVTIAMVSEPSGSFWVSASGEDGFVVTFESSPVPNPDVRTPTLVGHWLASL